jgi:cell fate (sporulation/competence/biofilm development) regulator YlbF (YheA/YmcA/DUF963 family)
MRKPRTLEIYVAEIYEKAKELGNALARTNEYRTLCQTIDAVDEDRELVELRNRIRELETGIETSMQAGHEPDEEITKAYAEVTEELQTKPGFQRLISAQANFEKVIFKVNETVTKGIDEGGDSRIILPS